MILPQLVANLTLGLFAVSPRNANTRFLGELINAYSTRPNVDEWLKLLEQLPQVTFANFFFSNFVFLPLLFLVLIVVARRRVPLFRVEKALLIAGAVVFLVNNLAPPYPGWQLRGLGMARLY